MHENGLHAVRGWNGGPEKDATYSHFKLLDDVTQVAQIGAEIVAYRGYVRSFDKEAAYAFMLELEGTFADDIAIYGICREYVHLTRGLPRLPRRNCEAEDTKSKLVIFYECKE